MTQNKICRCCAEIMELKMVTYPWGESKQVYECPSCGRRVDIDKVMPDIEPVNN